MTTLEIILIIAVVYLLIAHIFNFICIADNCILCDAEDLLCNLFWIVLLPIALIKRFSKALDKIK